MRSDLLTNEFLYFLILIVILHHSNVIASPTRHVVLDFSRYVAESSLRPVASSPLIPLPPVIQGFGVLRDRSGLHLDNREAEFQDIFEPFREALESICRQ